jgi:hypothetical protein
MRPFTVQELCRLQPLVLHNSPARFEVLLKIWLATLDHRKWRVRRLWADRRRSVQRSGAASVTAFSE